jgi:FkbM family methyltransferase
MRSKPLQWLHYKVRFGLSKLPVFPARYSLPTDDAKVFRFWWSKVMPFMDPVKGAFNFDLYGWDVRELKFLCRYLRFGMRCLDIGSHHGLYSILASQLVGPGGKVVAIEPAPQVFRRLQWHLRLNGCRDVVALQTAMGSMEGEAVLHMPSRGVDTVSSLRRAAMTETRTQQVRVTLQSLDQIVSRELGGVVDFVKLDVEGAEMDVLDGAVNTMSQKRALWLFEALDLTGAAWNHSARDLVERFIAAGHAIYGFTPDGYLVPHDVQEFYPMDSNCNLLAVPFGCVEVVEHLVGVQ